MGTLGGIRGRWWIILNSTVFTIIFWFVCTVIILEFIYSLIHFNISLAFKKTFIEHLVFAGTSKVMVLSLLWEARDKRRHPECHGKVCGKNVRQSQGLPEFSAPELGHSKGLGGVKQVRVPHDSGSITKAWLWTVVWMETRRQSWELGGSQNRHDLVTG